MGLHATSPSAPRPPVPARVPVVTTSSLAGAPRVVVLSYVHHFLCASSSPHTKRVRTTTVPSTTHTPCPPRPRPPPGCAPVPLPLPRRHAQ